MFDLKKVIYNSESYQNIDIDLNENGVEFIDDENKVRSYVPFYNIYTVEQKTVTKLWLKIFITAFSLFLSYVVLQSFQYTLQTFTDYGLFQFLMLVIISLSIGYLFAITVIYICVKNNILVWNAIIIKNDAARIKLVYDNKVQQKKAYKQIKQTIENMHRDVDEKSIPLEL